MILVRRSSKFELNIRRSSKFELNINLLYHWKLVDCYALWQSRSRLDRQRQRTMVNPGPMVAPPASTASTVLGPHGTGSSRSRARPSCRWGCGAAPICCCSMPLLLCALAAVMLLPATAARGADDTGPVRAGAWRFIPSSGGEFGGKWGVALPGLSAPWQQLTPLQLEIVSADGSSRWIRKGYDLISADGSRATGLVTTPGGARLSATDIYGADAGGGGGGFTVNRSIAVLDGGDREAEVGFGSLFSLGGGVGLRGLDVFMPGSRRRDCHWWHPLCIHIETPTQGRLGVQHLHSLAAG